MQLVVFSMLLMVPTFVSAKQLIPMGQSIGVQLDLPYVYVTHDVLLPSGKWLKAGDILTAINNEALQKVKMLEKVTQTANLNIERNDIELNYQIKPDELANILPFLKDETDGIGTLTFVDPTSGEYGALGHQIIDSSLDKPPDFLKGAIYMASIQQVKKSIPGQPGYKVSVIDRNQARLGNVSDNQIYGIFGKWENTLQQSVQQPMEIIHAQQVKPGKAQLLTAIKGNEVQAYDIEIQKKESKTFQFIVKDEELLQKTGGILQGMSGSPIVQNGQFVGAVTHMYVDEPTKGAAIFIIEMLKKTPN